LTTGTPAVKFAKIQEPIPGRGIQLEYGRLWNARRNVDDFGNQLGEMWTAEYLSSTGADPGDLVVVDPGNGFSYVFDLAGSLGVEPCSWAPRVVGVWGCSQPGGARRDQSRMRGHPRPRRDEDDRGHLIACAAGGGYDVNLVPMNAALNRGWSPEGARFRAIERRAAEVPGTLFFIRALYDDDTDRPHRFEVGVQIGTELLVDAFLNTVGPVRRMPLAELRRTAALTIDDGLVAGCLDPRAVRDALFTRGWRHGPAGLTRAERCAVAGVTGHVAESVTELLLDALGWRVLWHHAGPGPHGVDLVLLTPDGKVVAVEVKGTLVAGLVPRLSHREMAQMSVAWVDKADNPGMAELGLQSTDVYGAVVAINFADMTWRIALTPNFSMLHAVSSVEQLTDLGWLAGLGLGHPASSSA
jgi:hypothetical protein